MIRRLVLPVVMVGALAACGGGGDAPAADDTNAPGATVDATASSVAPATDSGAGTVPAALQFSAPLVGGGDIEAASLAGRPVLLWFWAPW